jgi:hypothetical protein
MSVSQTAKEAPGLTTRGHFWCSGQQALKRIAAKPLIHWWAREDSNLQPL